MIKKFKEIKNLAVFHNFQWDKSVLGKDGNVLEFKQINILYGRNYAGKTTLSRILRAIERGKISDKFENPSFCVSFADNTEIKQDELTGHGIKVRVFNDDFVRDNLKFISNHDESIEPFAILGFDNQRIEEEIKLIQAEIGSKEEGKETGLTAQLKTENVNLSLALSNHQTRRNQLDSKLNSKATNRNVGIKYKFEKYGDQNYSRPKIDNDIQTVLGTEFKVITNEQQTALEKVITESSNNSIPPMPKVSLNIGRFCSDTRTLIQQKFGESTKIKELAKEAVLNKWVKEGKQLHKDKRKKCAFCNNDIEESRWAELEKHFDEASDKLEKNIDSLLNEIDLEIISVTNGYKPNTSLFYTKYHSLIEKTDKIYKLIAKKYNKQLTKLKVQLLSRKNDSINPIIFNEIAIFSKRVESIFSIYDKIRIESNSYSSSLAADQIKAKASLRLREVYDFITTINYSAEVIAIHELENKVQEAKVIRDKIANDIYLKNDIIESKRRELKDESKGADKVNEYLHNFFGHAFLSLKAVEFESTDTIPIKKFRFDVIRDKKKAYHLSEGECSLVAFCYFMAKLDEIETKGVKPIIWIDDPISSLDANHVFFVYSLLKSKIVDTAIFKQLFVSTHNLDFLKYLKRLSGDFTNSKGKKTSFERAFFLISRKDKIADIQVMPNYLKNYITEFNYLFEQIYKCSQIDNIDDNNYTVFYNFANNARKFLEIYLYYKYPDSSKDFEKLTKFFDTDTIPAILIDRINNEYSHMCAVFERGAAPIEVPEMKKSAQLIISKLKNDKHQFESLLKSIGVEIVKEEVA